MPTTYSRKRGFPPYSQKPRTNPGVGWEGLTTMIILGLIVNHVAYFSDQQRERTFPPPTGMASWQWPATESPSASATTTSARTPPGQCRQPTSKPCPSIGSCRLGRVATGTPKLGHQPRRRRRNSKQKQRARRNSSPREAEDPAHQGRRRTRNRRAAVASHVHRFQCFCWTMLFFCCIAYW